MERVRASGRKSYAKMARNPTWREQVRKRKRERECGLSHYDAILRDMVLTTFRLLPAEVRAQYATELVYDSAFYRVAWGFDAVEEAIVKHFPEP